MEKDALGAATIAMTALEIRAPYITKFHRKYKKSRKLKQQFSQLMLKKTELEERSRVTHARPGCPNSMSFSEKAVNAQKRKENLKRRHQLQSHLYLHQACPT